MALPEVKFGPRRVAGCSILCARKFIISCFMQMCVHIHTPYNYTHICAYMRVIIYVDVKSPAVSWTFLCVSTLPTRSF